MGFVNDQRKRNGIKGLAEMLCCGFTNLQMKRSEWRTKERTVVNGFLFEFICAGFYDHVDALFLFFNNFPDNE